MIVQNGTHYNNRGDLQNIASSAAILRGCVVSSFKLPRNDKNTVKLYSLIGNLYDQVLSISLILPTKGFYSRNIKEMDET